MALGGCGVHVPYQQWVSGLTGQTTGKRVMSPLLQGTQGVQIQCITIPVTSYTVRNSTYVVQFMYME